jgi:hypothetical protein
MKFYVIDRIRGGIQLTCTRCSYLVNTLDLDLKDGNLRTQAATAMNRHIAEEHARPSMIYFAAGTPRPVWQA